MSKPHIRLHVLSPPPYGLQIWSAHYAAGRPYQVDPRSCRPGYCYWTYSTFLSWTVYPRDALAALKHDE